MKETVWCLIDLEFILTSGFCWGEKLVSYLPQDSCLLWGVYGKGQISSKTIWYGRLTNEKLKKC